MVIDHLPLTGCAECQIVRHDRPKGLIGLEVGQVEGRHADRVAIEKDTIVAVPRVSRGQEFVPDGIVAVPTGILAGRKFGDTFAAHAQAIEGLVTQIGNGTLGRAGLKNGQGAIEPVKHRKRRE